MRILDYAQPKAEQQTTAQVKGVAAPISSEKKNDSDEQRIERRSNTDRRENDRRMQQAATFLNTRKMQGRRVSHGRRATDLTGKLSYKPISLKG